MLTYPLPTAADVDVAAAYALRRRRRWALGVAWAIALMLPACSHYLQLEAGQRQVGQAADDLADTLTKIASQDPEGWSYHVGRFTMMLDELHEDEPRAAMRIFASGAGESFVSPGWQSSSLLAAEREIFDSGTMIGIASVQYPTDVLWTRLILAALTGGLLGLTVYWLIAHVAIGDVLRHIKQLHEMRDAAARAGNARTAFLAAMSHEIRTPMNGVIGMASLLRETRLDEQQHRYVQVLIDSGEGLLRVINDILDFSRLESGRTTLECHATDSERLYRGVVRLLEPMVESKGLQLDLHIDQTVPDWIEVDADRLRQVLLNLIGNSIKFSQRGTVQVTVRAAGVGRLSTTITDQGIGMDSAQLATVFTPFVQADSTIARRYGGTGLGLSISQRLVQAMGGSISATSQVGEGSVFRFEIDAPAASPNLVTDSVHTQPHLDLSALKVLVVEDNEVNTIVVNAMLQALGISAETAMDAAAAVAAVSTGQFDVVLMDLELGEVNGLDTARLIRALPLRKQPRIVAVTAHVLAEMRDQCKQAGMDAFVSKPISLPDLERCLTQLHKDAPLLAH